MQLGTILKQARQAQHLTQKAVAQGICSQSMLSAIEHHQYQPNAQLLIQLCQRLRLSLDQVSLMTHYSVSSTNTDNQTVETLCNQHRYRELKTFLQSSDITQRLVPDVQLQAYYYYLGIADWQTTHIRQTANTYLNMALASVPTSQFDSTLTRLIHAALNLINRQADWSPIFSDLDQTNYSENQNSLFYLAGLAAFEQQDYLTATAWVNQGIDFTTAHNSHYMLANDFYLLARAATDSNQAAAATQKQTILSQLFTEKIYQDF